MRKINKTIDIFFYIIPTLFLVVPFLFRLVYYPISDDYLLTSVANGTYNNEPNSHLNVINITLGFVWEKLYSIIPNVEWYALSMILLISFNVYVLLFLLKKRINKWIALAAVIMIEVLLLAWISFTTVAYLSAFVLGLFIFEYMNSKINTLKSLIIIIVITFGGFCFRNIAFISGFVAVVPLIVVNIDNEKIKRIALPAATIALVVFSCFFVHKIAYSDANWNKSIEWANARASVVDYPILKYDGNEEKFKEIGFSKNDYDGFEMIGYMADLKTYSTKNMNKIVQMTPKNIRYNTDVLQAAKAIASLKEFWGFIIIIIAMLFINKNKKQLIFSFLEMACVIGQFLYLFYIGRAPERILIPVFYLSIFSILFYSLYGKNISDIKNLVKGICIVIPLLLVISYGKQIVKVRSIHLARQQKYGEIERSISKDKKHLYVINNHNMVLMNKPIALFEKPTRYNNILELSNYEVLFNPIYYDLVKKYKLTYSNNLMLDIAVDDIVLFIDLDGKYIDNIKKYIEEHSGENVVAENIKTLQDSNTNIYKIKFY